MRFFIAHPAIMASNVDKNKGNAQDPQVDAFFANTCALEREDARRSTKFSVLLGKFRLVLEKSLALSIDHFHFCHRQCCIASEHFVSTCNRLGKVWKKKLFVLQNLRPFRKGIFSLSRRIRRRTTFHGSTGFVFFSEIVTAKLGKFS